MQYLITWSCLVHSRKWRRSDSPGRSQSAGCTHSHPHHRCHPDTQIHTHPNICTTLYYLSNLPSAVMTSQVGYFYGRTGPWVNATVKQHGLSTGHRQRIGTRMLRSTRYRPKRILEGLTEAGKKSCTPYWRLFISYIFPPQPWPWCMKFWWTS